MNAPRIRRRRLMQMAALAPAVTLLPPLILAATWSNAVTMSGASMMTRTAALPILLHNALLMGIYTMIFSIAYGKRRGAPEPAAA